MQGASKWNSHISAVCCVVGVFLAASPAFSEQNDVAIALRTAKSYKLNPFQTHALLCIRQIENGREGREYGVLHPQALDRREDGTQNIQAQWAAGSIKKRLPDPSAIEAFANRWAPPNASNDPTGLNHNWIGNFKACLSQFGESV